MSQQTEQELQLLKTMQVADLALDANNLEKAASDYQQALAGYDRLVSRDNADRLHCMKQLAECYHQMGLYVESKALWGEVCGVFHDMEPLPVDKYIVSMFKFTKACEKEGDDQKTEEAYTYLLVESDKLLPPSHPLLISIRQNQIKFLHDIGKKEDAEPLEHELRQLSHEAQTRAMAQNILGDASQKGTNPRITRQHVQAMKRPESEKTKTTMAEQKKRSVHPLLLLAFILLAAVVAFVWSLIHPAGH
jgi:hypothetical protein